jgi:hypothetical protein
MTVPPRPQVGLWILIVTGAALAWITPLVVVWLGAQDARRAPRRPGPGIDQPPAADGPLILYADTWPTRAVVNLEEIQGRSTESDVALGTQVVAKDLSLALQQLGVVSETRRLDSITDPHALLSHRQIVLIYPTRHAQPPWQVTRFIDHDLEPLVASQDPRLRGMQVRDVAIAEDAAPASRAQSSLAAAMAYYSITYRSGPALLEEMNSLVIYKQLQSLAAELKKQAAAHD